MAAEESIDLSLPDDGLGLRNNTTVALIVGFPPSYFPYGRGEGRRWDLGNVSPVAPEESAAVCL